MSRGVVACLACFSSMLRGNCGSLIGVEFLGSAIFETDFKLPANAANLGGKEVGGISALKFQRKANGAACDPGLEICPVYMLRDNGDLYTLDLDIRGGTLNQTGVKWRDSYSHLHAERNGSTKEYADSEGLAVGRKSNTSVLVSLEGNKDTKYDLVKSDVQRISVPDGKFVSAPYLVPEWVTKFEETNHGFESLSRTPTGQKVVTANEYHLTVDSPRVHRLIQFNAAGGAPTKILKYVSEPELANPTKGMGLPEVETIDDAALDGGVLLTLERSWDSVNGNNIHLYEADTAGAMDVSECADLKLGEATACGNKTAVAKNNLFVWNKTVGLRSASGPPNVYPDVPTDNYEAMTLVPPTAKNPIVGPGGRMLLLVNDNNLNDKQLGTQLVLLRLLGAPTTTTTVLPGGSMSRQSGSLSVLQWILVGGLSACGLGLCLLCIGGLMMCTGKKKPKGRRSASRNDVYELPPLPVTPEYSPLVQNSQPAVRDAEMPPLIPLAPTTMAAPSSLFTYAPPVTSTMFTSASPVIPPSFSSYSSSSPILGLSPTGMLPTTTARYPASSSLGEGRYLTTIS